MGTRTRIIAVRISIVLSFRTHNPSRVSLIASNSIARRLIQAFYSRSPYIHAACVGLILIPTHTNCTLARCRFANTARVSEFGVVGVLGVATPDIDGAHVGAVEV